MTAGFGAIEAIANGFVRDHPQAGWYYGNIYEADGVTPIDWWQ